VVIGVDRIRRCRIFVYGKRSWYLLGQGIEKFSKTPVFEELIYKLEISQMYPPSEIYGDGD
jgi:hypothetical protein